MRQESCVCFLGVGFLRGSDQSDELLGETVDFEGILSEKFSNFRLAYYVFHQLYSERGLPDFLETGIQELWKVVLLRVEC